MFARSNGPHERSKALQLLSLQPTVNFVTALVREVEERHTNRHRGPNLLAISVLAESGS